jgi:hypothetical protein
MILDETSVGMVYMQAPGINTCLNFQHINASNKERMYEINKVSFLFMF